MWDSNSPLQLLKSMPNKLSKENLEKIQLVIEADKYKNSLINGFDLCGMYAPFCKGCKKSSIYPCAISYINMMKAQGMDIEIDAKPMGYEPQPYEEENKAEHSEAEIAVTSTVQEEQPVVEQPVEEQPTVQEEVAVSTDYAEEQKVEQTKPLNEPSTTAVKRKIRIAVARKKI